MRLNYVSLSGSYICDELPSINKQMNRNVPRRLGAVMSRSPVRITAGLQEDPCEPRTLCSYSALTVRTTGFETRSNRGESRVVYLLKATLFHSRRRPISLSFTSSSLCRPSTLVCCSASQSPISCCFSVPVTHSFFQLSLNHTLNHTLSHTLLQLLDDEPNEWLDV